jgi:hypothetical protein
MPLVRRLKQLYRITGKWSFCQFFSGKSALKPAFIERVSFSNNYRLYLSCGFSLSSCCLLAYCKEVTSKTLFISFVVMHPGNT